MRQPIVAGNWKMNLLGTEANALVQCIIDTVGSSGNGVKVMLAPPSVYLERIVHATHDSPVRVGAQNIWHEASGAFTGEISPAMVRDTGADFVIVGHSERRTTFGESDDLVRLKADAAHHHGLDIVVCVGETEAERENGATEAILKRQVTHLLGSDVQFEPDSLTFAYEPVWAIGTGKTATPDIAQEAHRFVRSLLSATRGERYADAVRVLYGGSVKPDNAEGLFAQPDIDGALVGGASLDCESFVEIIRARQEESKS